jgi:CheY-like chemotaxis protein
MAHDKERRRDPQGPLALDVDHPGAPRSVPDAGGVSAVGRHYRVLVAEDNPHVVGMYQYAIRKLGGGDGVNVAVEHAANGHDALLRLAATPRIDLVMADLYMPVLDGFTLIGRMKADPSLARIPIVVISAGAADARVRALDLGVDVYLQKPVQFADIINTVRALLGIKP